MCNETFIPCSPVDLYFLYDLAVLFLDENHDISHRFQVALIDAYYSYDILWLLNIISCGN